MRPMQPDPAPALGNHDRTQIRRNRDGDAGGATQKKGKPRKCNLRLALAGRCVQIERAGGGLQQPAPVLAGNAKGNRGLPLRFREGQVQHCWRWQPGHHGSGCADPDDRLGPHIGPWAATEQRRTTLLCRIRAKHHCPINDKCKNMAQNQIAAGRGYKRV